MNKFDLMVAWRLSPIEASILFKLHESVDIVSYEEIQTVASRGAVHKSEGLGRVYMCRLRNKLESRGIEIQTFGRKGYALTAASVARLSEYLDWTPRSSAGAELRQAS